MPTRNVGKGTCALVMVLTGASAVVACGSSKNGSDFSDAAADASSPEHEDATADHHTDDARSLVGDGGTGGEGCAPKTCAELGYNCGTNGDGCGNQIDCGTCPAEQKCGNGGFSVCGRDIEIGPDGGVLCIGSTCQGLGYDCGYAGDGCGNLLDCSAAPAGGCAQPQFCGGGGFNQCGGNDGLQPDGSVPCQATTCAALGYDCGYAGDGCGNLLDCNQGVACTNPQYCGGGGFNKCGGNSGLGPDGAPNCTKSTCMQQGFNCGPAGDGCGGPLTCGTCGAGDTCGGGGTPSQCGHPVCTGLCLQQQSCSAGAKTTITGTVVAGTPAIYGSPDPVPNVVVYVPNTTPQPFVPRAVQPTCSQCAAEVTGNPLVETTTAFDGTFTLSNVPAGANVPVVIQLGRWRRTFTFTVPSCATTPVGNLVMPHNKTEGDVPLTAISTGSVDAIECVLLKMGIDPAEFTSEGGGGRVNLYSGLPGSGASAGPNTTDEGSLMGQGGTYDSYDQILFPCWGAEYSKPFAELGNLVTYANTGGHFFATHFSYTWLFQNNPFNTTAEFNVNHGAGNGPASFAVEVPPVNPKGAVFSQWLHLVGASPTPQSLPITAWRHDVDKSFDPSVGWIEGADPNDGTPILLHYTFDTPLGAANQCGHVIFSDFHVSGVNTNPNIAFPSECDASGLTAQEKVLEYMIWDLASCVPGPPTPPMCTPVSCQAQKINCGPASDGCGNAIASCGTCTPPATCGGGTAPGQCGTPDGGACTPKTCLEQKVTCGPTGDGCGNKIDNCGTCASPQVCGGGGVPGECGYPDAGRCIPKTCAQQNLFCGPAGDGCGGEIASCGSCTLPQTCGGAGVAGQCGLLDAGPCAPSSCAVQKIQCGVTGDGCGNLLQCPGCPAGQTCDTTSGQCAQSSQ